MHTQDDEFMKSGNVSFLLRFIRFDLSLGLSRCRDGFRFILGFRYVCIISLECVRTSIYILIVVDKSNYWAECSATSSPYGMCFFEIKKDERMEQFGLKDIEESMQQYRRFEKRLKFRSKLNKKLPFLKNTKFNVLSKS